MKEKPKAAPPAATTDAPAPVTKVAPARPESGRVVKRWVAECDFFDPKVGKSAPCAFGAREKPRLHADVDTAVREARDHAIEAGHIGAREVHVRRKYTPRTIASEEIVS